MNRQYSYIKWLLAGGVLAVLGYLLYHNMPWFHGGNAHFVQEKYRSMNGHTPFTRGGFRGEPSGFHHSIHWASLLIKLGLLLFGGLLWAKGKGLTRWAGGLFTIIIMLSLLNPLLCAVIVGIVYWFHRRLNKHGEAAPIPLPATTLTPYSHPDYNRAHVLDEWEKNTTKEEH